jgi:hypothetical protein
VNGSVGLSLRLFNTSSGGVAIYTDSNTVTVVDGLYSTFIGDNPASELFLVALTNPAIWVEVVVNGTTLTPRERLVSVGYSLATRGLYNATNGTIILNPQQGSNSVHASAIHASVAGGKLNDIGMNANYAVIGGGYDNDVAEGNGSVTIAGGNLNNIYSNSFYSSIGGGSENYVAANNRSATIAGGDNNSIGVNSDYSSVGGGGFNVIAANSELATIPGGRENYIGPGATNAFAAGRRANAIHRGSFVWGDDTNAGVTSSANNQVTFRATGGFRVLNGPIQALGGLSVGGGQYISHLQYGTAVLGTGINVSVYSVNFPQPFLDYPRMMVTIRNNPSFNVNDTFVATIRSSTPTNFTINVVRVDAAAGWAQQLLADWVAWIE